MSRLCGLGLIQHQSIIPNSNCTRMPLDFVNRDSNKITFAILYYSQPELLKRNLDTIYSYPQSVHDNIHLLIIDDASPVAASRFIPHRPPWISVYYITPDLLWNIGGARNLAFHVAPTEKVFLFDVDMIVPLNVAERVISFVYDSPRTIHRFNRRRPRGDLKLSPASMVIDRRLYWENGGCDEDFVGHYGFTDVHFWYRMDRRQHVRIVHHPDLILREQGNGSSKNRIAQFNARVFDRKRRHNSWSNEILRFNFTRDDPSLYRSEHPRHQGV